MPSLWCVWQDDTANLFTYAVLRLTPHALSYNMNSWSYLRKGTAASHATVHSSLPNPGSTSEEFQYSSHDTSPGRQGSGYQVPRPLKRDKWSKGKDGFLVTDIWGSDAGCLNCATPTVWLQQTGECVYLSIYQHKNLTIIILIPVSSFINGEQGISWVKQQLLQNVSNPLFDKSFLWLLWNFYMLIFWRRIVGSCTSSRYSYFFWRIAGSCTSASILFAEALKLGTCVTTRDLDH